MSETIHTKEQLAYLVSLPLEQKVEITKNRIVEWYQHFDGNVAVSFSGGKDSTVLLHIARSVFPDIKAVFSNTGLEYPEIQTFVRKQENVDIIRPSKSFTEVISDYGYPIIGKEIAEAIYYARRIVPKDAAETECRERERERRVGQLLAVQRPTDSNSQGKQNSQIDPQRESGRSENSLEYTAQTAHGSPRHEDGATIAHPCEQKNDGIASPVFFSRRLHGRVLSNGLQTTPRKREELRGSRERERRI